VERPPAEGRDSAEALGGGSGSARGRKGPFDGALDSRVGKDCSKNPNLLTAALAGGRGTTDVQDKERECQQPIEH
jgi:hypothetical protein